MSYVDQRVNVSENLCHFYHPSNDCFRSKRNDFSSFILIAATCASREIAAKSVDWFWKCLLKVFFFFFFSYKA